MHAGMKIRFYALSCLFEEEREVFLIRLRMLAMVRVVRVVTSETGGGKTTGQLAWSAT